jgi:hypothetical protein
MRQTDHERRRARRHFVRARVMIHPEGGNGEVRRCLLQDFSVHGVGLLCKEALACGAQFVIQLRPQKGETQAMLYTVVTCRRYNATWFHIGAEFTCVKPMPVWQTPEDEVERLRRAVLG